MFIAEVVLGVSLFDAHPNTEDAEKTHTAPKQRN